LSELFWAANVWLSDQYFCQRASMSFGLYFIGSYKVAKLLSYKVYHEGAKTQGLLKDNGSKLAPIAAKILFCFVIPNAVEGLFAKKRLQRKAGQLPVKSTMIVLLLTILTQIYAYCTKVKTLDVINLQ